jgi:hypothetical protein
MIEDATELPNSQGGPRLAGRHSNLVGWATWVGLILASVALVAGLRMAIEKDPVTCPNGTFFPQGTTEFSCYAHPQAGLGIAIAALSVVLGILVVFSSILVRASLPSARSRPVSGGTASAL